MPLIEALLPGSIISTVSPPLLPPSQHKKIADTQLLGLTVSLVTYALIWYLNSSFCVALVLIALPSIMAWIYTIVLLVLKRWKMQVAFSRNPSIVADSSQTELRRLSYCSSLPSLSDLLRAAVSPTKSPLSG